MLVVNLGMFFIGMVVNFCFVGISLFGMLFIFVKDFVWIFRYLVVVM